MTRLDPAREGAADIIARKHADKAVSDMRRAEMRQRTVRPWGEASGASPSVRADQFVARHLYGAALVIGLAAAVVVTAAYIH